MELDKEEKLKHLERISKKLYKKLKEDYLVRGSVVEELHSGDDGFEDENKN